MRSLWQKQTTYKNYTLYARGKKKLTTLKQLAIKPSLSFGGGKRNRTDDPLLAWQALSQLSYTPRKDESIVLLLVTMRGLRAKNFCRALSCPQAVAVPTGCP